MTPNLGNITANMMNSQQQIYSNLGSINTPPVLNGFLNPQQITTVFVGAIDPQAPDEMIIRMLRTCGTVSDWKRASGANGTMQPFGFVKFEDFESTLRAIRIMDGISIGEKSLVVKLSEGDQKKLNK